MFGKNSITGRKFFDKSPEANAGKLLVTSIFFTLQGEGPLRGEPAVFVRLAKCNLACAFCDTFFDAGNWLTLEEIEAEVERQIATYFKGSVPEWAQITKRAQREEIGQYVYQGRVEQVPRQMALVVTGGEPTLQTNLSTYLMRARYAFAKTQIETNGIQPLDLPAETIVVCSPKAAVRQGAGRYLTPHAAVLQRADCLKFVMEAKQSCPCPPGQCNSSGYSDDECLASPYSEIPVWAHNWHRETGRPIFVSPMNTYTQQPTKAGAQAGLHERSTVDETISFWTPGLLDLAAVERNHKYAAQYCLQHGFIFNMQQHLFASLA